MQAPISIQELSGTATPRGSRAHAVEQGTRAMATLLPEVTTTAPQRGRTFHEPKTFRHRATAVSARDGSPHSAINPAKPYAPSHAGHRPSSEETLAKSCSEAVSAAALLQQRVCTAATSTPPTSSTTRQVIDSSSCCRWHALCYAPLSSTIGGTIRRHRISRR